MRGQIFKFWDRVRSSFWFIPAVMAGVAVALALVGVTVDEPITEWLALELGWTFAGGAEGASAVMGIVAGSMIAIAGVVFSMTLVALSLASSQLGRGASRIPVEEDLIVRLEERPGNKVTDGLTDKVHPLFILGHQRTSGQDLEFAVSQLVEIAVRALSPGMSDPFTAITCLDHLGSGLCRLASRDMPSPYRYDGQNQLRVIAPAMIARGANKGLPEDQDRRSVEARYQAVRKLCSEPAQSRHE